jgi:hypothetical protein
MKVKRKTVVSVVKVGKKAKHWFSSSDLNRSVPAFLGHSPQKGL